MRNLVAFLCLIVIGSGYALELNQFTDAAALTVQDIDKLAVEFVNQDEEYEEESVANLRQEKESLVEMYTDLFGEHAISLIEYAASSALGFGAAPAINGTTVLPAINNSTTTTPVQAAKDAIKASKKAEEKATPATVTVIPVTKMDKELLAEVKKTAKTTAENSIKANAPALHKRIMKARQIARVKKITQYQALYDIPANAVDGLNALDALKLIKKAGKKAAIAVAKKAGLTKSPKKNRRNMILSLTAARQVVRDAVDAAVNAAVSKIETRVDEQEEKKDEQEKKKDEQEEKKEKEDDKKAAAFFERKAQRSPVPKTAEGGQASYHGPENLPSVDAPVAAPIKGAAANQFGFPTTPISSPERDKRALKWKNLALAAPNTQLLWAKSKKYEGAHENKITQELTFRTLTEADLKKKSNDMDEIDIPKLLAPWNDFIISLDGSGAKKQRDFCNPNICLNDMPCGNGKCQCGSKFSGELCEIVNATPIQLQWKPSLVETTNEEDYEARIAKLRHAKLQADYATRNMSTIVAGPVYAHSVTLDTPYQSVLNEKGLFDPTVVIQGPEITSMGAYMPDTLAYADRAIKAIVKKGSVYKASKREIKRGRKFNMRVMNNRVALHKVVAAEIVNNPMPSIPTEINTKYFPVTIQPSATLVRVKNLLNKQPLATVPDHYRITSK